MSHAEELRAVATRMYQAYLRADMDATNAEWSESVRAEKAERCPRCRISWKRCPCPTLD